MVQGVITILHIIITPKISFYTPRVYSRAHLHHETVQSGSVNNKTEVLNLICKHKTTAPLFTLNLSLITEKHDGCDLKAMYDFELVVQ